MPLLGLGVPVVHKLEGCVLVYIFIGYMHLGFLVFEYLAMLMYLYQPGLRRTEWGVFKLR